MNKVLLVIVGGLLLGGMGAGTYLILSDRKQQNSIGSPNIVITPTPSVALLLWDDPAGFSMQYPADVSVDKHDEDTVNYAHVELTHPDHPGNLIIWVQDLPKGVADTSSWWKKIATHSSAISLDTKLGLQPAKKILTHDLKKTSIVGVVYDNVVWSVVATLTDEAYWQNVFDIVTNSFAFKPIDVDTNSSGNETINTDNFAVDEEEILE